MLEMQNRTFSRKIKKKKKRKKIMKELANMIQKIIMMRSTQRKIDLNNKRNQLGKRKRKKFNLKSQKTKLVKESSKNIQTLVITTKALEILKT
jgi:phage/plasmid primase-like uncharacterized protein